MNSELIVRAGTLEDYRRLARFHYRAGRPATCVRVLVAAERSGAAPVGVLVVSMPTINGPWRERAWPGSYAARGCGPGARRAAAVALNAGVRTISRVIVEPRHRGLGVGAGLVRAYLRAPLTFRTEAVAAMGRFCPVFERAGMRAVSCPPSRRVARLRRVLRGLGVEPWRLAAGAPLLDALGAARAERLVIALRRFAADHRDTRAAAEASPAELLSLAARRVACRPTAYVHEACSAGGEAHHAA